MVGGAYVNAYALIATLGAGFDVAVATGVLVNIGMQYFGAQGPSYQVRLALSLIQGPKRSPDTMML
jgi:hypothetical protein